MDRTTKPVLVVTTQIVFRYPLLDWAFSFFTGLGSLDADATTSVSLWGRARERARDDDESKDKVDRKHDCRLIEMQDQEVNRDASTM